MKPRKSDSNESDSLVIAEGVFINGSIKTHGEVIIKGELNGGIRSSSKTKVAPSGKIIGAIVSDVVEVDGVVEGDIYAKTKVSVNAGATVLGDIYTAKLMVEKESFFNGKIKMDEAHSGSSEISVISELQPLIANT